MIALHHHLHVYHCNHVLRFFTEQPHNNLVECVFHAYKTVKNAKMGQFVNNAHLHIIYKTKLSVFHNVVQLILNKLIIKY